MLPELDPILCILLVCLLSISIGSFSFGWWCGIRTTQPGKPSKKAQGLKLLDEHRVRHEIFFTGSGQCYHFDRECWGLRNARDVQDRRMCERCVKPDATSGTLAVKHPERK